MSKKNTGMEFLEDPDALAGQFDRVEDFYDQNKNIVWGILGGILLLVAGFVGYRYYVGSQDETTQAELFPSVYQVEADSLKKALKGSWKKTGNL